MFLPAVAKNGWTVPPGVTLMLIRPLLEDVGPAYCEPGDTCIQRAQPPEPRTGSSTAKEDEVPGEVPFPSTKRPFSGRDRAGSVVGELQRRPPSSMRCIMSHERRRA